MFFKTKCPDVTEIRNKHGVIKNVYRPHILGEFVDSRNIYSVHLLQCLMP